MHDFTEEENELKCQRKSGFDWFVVNSNDHTGYLGSFTGTFLQGSPGFSGHTNFSPNNRC